MRMYRFLLVVCVKEPIKWAAWMYYSDLQNVVAPYFEPMTSHCILTLSLYYSPRNDPSCYLSISLLTRSLYITWMCREATDSGIRSWDWKLEGKNSTYHALYPRAWTVYDGNG